MTIRLAIGHFPLVLHCDQASISNSFWDIGLQSACPQCPVQIVIAHVRYHVRYLYLYAKFGYIFEFPTPTLPIHYDTFIELRWRLRGVYSCPETPTLKAKSSENFVPTKIWQILAGLEVWGQGFQKVAIFFTPKRHVLAWIHVVWAILRQNRSRDVTSMSGRFGKNSHRDSHKKDMSPLTQGLKLNYRSACDSWKNSQRFVKMRLILFKHI